MGDDPKLLDPVVDATAVVCAAIADVDDVFWKLELATHSVLARKPAGQRQGLISNTGRQLVASLLALMTLLWLTVRHRGTSSGTARRILSQTAVVFAVHGEDTTRTRHLRQALARYQANPKTVLILGRPDCSVEAAAKRLDPASMVEDAVFIRPLDLASVIVSLPGSAAALLRGLRETRRYRLPLPMRERVAIAFRVALGIAQAKWWSSAASALEVRHAIFAHTGNADTSRLERAMQAHATATIHLVHGTNIGWAFAGLSDVGIFQTGFDAHLAAGLSGYGRCSHLSLEKPTPARGNGDWALLTSYTHLLSSAYQEHGSSADCAVVGWMREAAAMAGQDPKRVFWRPHPQIEIVAPHERERLLAAIAEAGFTPWPADLPYEAMGRFSIAVTTPSTALTDGLRLGQPVIIASATPLQRDLLYAPYPLLAQDSLALSRLIARVANKTERALAFDEAWQAIEPGAAADIAQLLEIA